MKAPKRPAGPKETTPLRLRRGRPVRSLLLSLLLQRTPPAQAHTPVAHRRRRQLAQVQAPNPNLRLIPAPSARNGMAQIPKARLPPTSNPKAQRTPNAHSDKEPNQPRLRSEPRRARTLDRLATCHDRRGLRNRSHPAKHTRRFEPVFTPVTFHGPFLKVIGPRKRLFVITHLIRSGESVLLAGSRVVSLATRGYFSRSSFHVHRTRTAIRAYV